MELYIRYPLHVDDKSIVDANLAPNVYSRLAQEIEPPDSLIVVSAP